ncbi:MAG TPA: CRISPR-associated endonuclease Cas3'', partial [Magnetococcales bacterium]|nr:CRISPR-associated endonuclease Cas3'' [Magnetococcales bacterium]
MSYWGKRQDLPDHSETHPLSHHVLEVAIVTLELLNLDIFRRRLSQALGLPDLSPHQRQRLAVLAALHDVGKCNHGFQDGRESRQWQTHGHVREIFKLLFDSPRSEEGFSALALAEITSWFTEATGTAIQDSPDPLIGWLWTVFCHHGRPLPGDPNSPGRPGELHKIS